MLPAHIPRKSRHIDDDVPQLVTEASRLLNLGKAREALRSLDRALYLDPGNAVAHNKAGVCYARLGEIEKAREEFEAAISADPQYASVYSNLGNICQETGELERALTLYEKAISLDPNHSTALHNLGLLYRRMRAYERSVPLLKRARSLEMQRSSTQNSGAGPAGRGKAYLVLAITIGVLVYYLFLRR
ncbi:MAG: tetratricopeptide repeat protein [Firmicutes bacterium]|jgi:tetratricopeptide (TPR) repeat protein|nr:tetratricopeptide repeat protein [Bacillota bacterium]